MNTLAQNAADAAAGPGGAFPQSVYYRIATNASDASFAQVAGIVSSSLPAESAFSPTMVAIATWYRVRDSDRA